MDVHKFGEAGDGKLQAASRRALGVFEDAAPASIASPFVHRAILMILIHP